MPDEAKRQAQEALYAAIQGQAESNMKAALSAPEKATLLRELAEAYRLTAGGSMPASTGRGEKSSGDGQRPRRSAEPSERRRRAG
jgi:hypothetical protein